jgi:hypothetical protein
VRKPTPPGQHIRLKRRFVRFQDGTRNARKMLKLRSIGISDYSVLEGRQRIGRIRFVIERLPGVWLWNVTVPLSGGLPMGSANDLDTAKAEFKAAWEALKSGTTSAQLAAAYKAMNIRDR